MGNGGEITAIKFIELIKKVARKTARNSAADMVIAEVTSLDPLEVDIGNNTRLTEEFLFLGQMCRPHKVMIPHTHIVDTHFTEKSPSIGSVGAGLLAGTAFEQAQSAAAKAKMNVYTTLNDDGSEKKEQVSDAALGRGSVSTSIVVTGQASVADDSVMITDNGHTHIIGRQITKDVHFPKSDYEECVTIEIEPKLKVGDKVLGFFFNSHQRLYIAERIEEAEE